MGSLWLKYSIKWITWTLLNCHLVLINYINPIIFSLTIFFHYLLFCKRFEPYKSTDITLNTRRYRIGLSYIKRLSNTKLMNFISATSISYTLQMLIFLNTHWYIFLWITMTRLYARLWIFWLGLYDCFMVDKINLFYTVIFTHGWFFRMFIIVVSYYHSLLIKSNLDFL